MAHQRKAVATTAWNIATSQCCKIWARFAFNSRSMSSSSLEGGPPRHRGCWPRHRRCWPRHMRETLQDHLLQKAVQFASASSTERPMVKVVCVADVVTRVRAAAFVGVG